MSATLTIEIRRILALCAAALVFCWLLDSWLPLALATLGWLAFTLWQVRRFTRWLQQFPTTFDPPDASGAWGELFDAMARLLRREVAAREELNQLIHRAETSVAAHRDAIVVCNRRGRLEFWNLAAQRLLGFRVPEDHGQLLTNLIREPTLVDYLQQGHFEHPITVASPLNEAVQLEFTITEFGSGEWLMVVRDITRLRTLEQMRKDFVANVSHELKTPLTVLKGYIETLLEVIPEDQKRVHRALMQMNQQSQRMDLLINDLLLLARLEGTEADNQSDVVALAPLLRRLRQDALALAPDKQQTVQLEISPGAALLGDYTELRSAFGNLITNAVKYSPAGATIRITWSEDAQGGHLAVQDNGPGIDGRHLPRLTERFYRPDTSRVTETGGTGLGLAITKHILIRHNGRLGIESQPGRGSTFTCHFPAWRLQQTPPQDED